MPLDDDGEFDADTVSMPVTMPLPLIRTPGMWPEDPADGNTQLINTSWIQSNFTRRSVAWHDMDLYTVFRIPVFGTDARICRCDFGCLKLSQFLDNYVGSECARRGVLRFKPNDIEFMPLHDTALVARNWGKGSNKKRGTIRCTSIIEDYVLRSAETQ